MVRTAGRVIVDVDLRRCGSQMLIFFVLAGRR
jgi:hypothetical protein